jgi:hypothetical protein
MSESFWSPDAIGYHRYEGFDLQTKHDWLKDGNSQGSQHVADSLKRISERLAQSDVNLRNATKVIGVEWTGQAASMLSGAALRASNWTTSTGDSAGTSVSQINQYGQSYDETKSKVTAPKANSVGFGDVMTEGANAATFGVFDMQSDYRKTANENKAADDAANRALYAHESVARGSYDSIPVVDAPADIAVSTAPASTPPQPGPSQPGPGFTSPPIIHHGTTTVGPTSQTPQQHVVTGHGSTSPPDLSTGAPPPAHGPGAVTTTASGAAMSTIPTPTGSLPTGFPGAGFPGGGTDYTRTGAPGFVTGGVFGGGDAVAGGSGSSARGGGTASGIRGGIAERLGAGAPAGRGSGTGSGAVSSEAEALRSGRAGSAATGRAGNGQLMQPAAGKAKKDEDQEHKDRFGRKSDAIFLDDIPTVAPTVIGESPHS